jgi:glycosyltransferase involved in cell wall biosynthesis
MPRPKLLFFVEGFTDIRFVTGLAEIAELTLCVPEGHYRSSGLRERVIASGAQPAVVEIPGGRFSFQARSFGWLWRHARQFDVILSQELLRGSLNATVIGALRGTPAVTTMALAPVEYFRCRQTRGQIGPLTRLAGEAVIRVLMTINGRLSTTCLVLGTYLEGKASAYCARTDPWGYYGVDTHTFAPANADERLAARRKWGLPQDKFIIFLSSRISHEKDPETVIRATNLARARGLDALLVNLSGGFQQFLSIARSLPVKDVHEWVVGRDAVHPMTEVPDFYKAADVVAQASLAEGLGLSPLEALACGTPVVATEVGGMAATLPGFARLVPRGDHEAMAEQFLWIAANRDAARAQALEGRTMVERDWSREKSFADLATVFERVAAGAAGRPVSARTVVHG